MLPRTYVACDALTEIENNNNSDNSDNSDNRDDRDKASTKKQASAFLWMIIWTIFMLLKTLGYGLFFSIDTTSDIWESKLIRLKN